MHGGNDERVDQGRVTLQAIAERLSVSTATVSLALRGNAVVAEATRERVRRVAEEMGYVYNRSAAALRTDRSQIVAVGIHDVTNPYFAELLGVLDEAKLLDWSQLIGSEKAGRVMAIMGAVMIVLRVITRAAVSFRPQA
jgi:LacI family transcriptional regulator